MVSHGYIAGVLIAEGSNEDMAGVLIAGNEGASTTVYCGVL